MHGYADADTISLSIYICMHAQPADSNAGRSEVGAESRVRSYVTLAPAEEMPSHVSYFSSFCRMYATDLMLLCRADSSATLFSFLLDHFYNTFLQVALISLVNAI